MRALVTGGAGYIGSVLVPVFLQRGYQVTVVDRFMYRQSPLLDVCHDPNLEIVRGDVRDRALMERLVPDHDLLIPLAALVGAPLCASHPDEAQSVNVGALNTLLDLRASDQIIIYPTTNSGYGIGQGDIACTEETPLRPISLYGRTKCEAEQRVLDSGNSITLRLATVFGVSPRMRLDLLVNDFTYRAMSDGFVVLFQPHFKRNFIHVRDVCAAFCHCIDHFTSMRDQPYNLGLSDANLSKLELCEHIKRFVPHFYFMEAPLAEDPDQRNYIVSNDKIESTGFKARYSLDDGIRELLKAYQVIRPTNFSNVS